MGKSGFLLAMALGLSSIAALAEERFDLPQLEAMALENNRNVRAANDTIEAARFGIVTASAFPNPEIEVLGGSSRPRVAGGESGSARAIAITQPIDLPGRRAARIAVAEAGLDVTAHAGASFRQRVLAEVRQRYFDVLRREAELLNSREDLALVQAVRGRIALRVDLGESPRFDLIRADAETKSAEMRAQAGGFRVLQARVQLQQAVGLALPEDFSLAGRLSDVPAVQDEVLLRRQMLASNPEIRRAEAEARRAGSAVEFEKMRRLPTLAVRGVVDEDPEVRDSRIGVVVSIPIWDQRRGPVGEAAAQLSRARNELEAQSFALPQALSAAYQQHKIAGAQVAALETGILKEAEAALRAAEAAYKFGERGFLEVLDAQRVFRAARTELIAARFELASAWVEIERLLASNERVQP